MAAEKLFVPVSGEDQGWKFCAENNIERVKCRLSGLRNKWIYSGKVLNLSIVDVRKNLLYTYLVKNVRI